MIVRPLWDLNSLFYFLKTQQSCIDSYSNGLISGSDFPLNQSIEYWPKPTTPAWWRQRFLSAHQVWFVWRLRRGLERRARIRCALDILGLCATVPNPNGLLWIGLREIYGGTPHIGRIMKNGEDFPPKPIQKCQKSGPEKRDYSIHDHPSTAVLISTATQMGF